MNHKRLYGLYENGKEVFRGSTEEIKDKFGDFHTTLGWYETAGCRLFKKYHVKVLGIYEEKKVEKPKPAIQKPDVYEYLVYHLMRYGNTVLNASHDVEKYVRKLKKNGIECKFYKAMDRDPAKRVRNPMKRKDQSWFWVIYRL